MIDFRKSKLKNSKTADYNKGKYKMEPAGSNLIRSKSSEALEDESGHDITGFSFPTHILKGWQEFFALITEHDKAKPIYCNLALHSTSSRTMICGLVFSGVEICCAFQLNCSTRVP